MTLGNPNDKHLYRIDVQAPSDARAPIELIEVYAPTRTRARMIAMEGGHIVYFVETVK